MNDNIVVHPRAFAPVHLRCRRRRSRIRVVLDGHLKSLEAVGKPVACIALVAIDADGGVHAFSHPSAQAVNGRLAWAMHSIGLAMLIKLLQGAGDGQ